MLTDANRLFFALWPDEPVRAAIAAAARELWTQHALGGYCTSPRRYHLTLSFLGDAVPADAERRAVATMQDFHADGFDWQLDCAGSFRNRQIPCWLGARETPPALTALHETLGAALKRANVAVEPIGFTPHLTIIRKAARPLPPQPITPIFWPVREIVLIRSVLDRRPAEYQVLARTALATLGPSVAAPAQHSLF